MKGSKNWFKAQKRKTVARYNRKGLSRHAFRKASRAFK